MKVLINASNLHHGGGVQVAASFIVEAFCMNRFNLNVICSSTVYGNIKELIDPEKFESFHVVDVYSFKPIEKQLRHLFDGYDVCFTIFGPFYHRVKVRKHFCGFAQPWIVYAGDDVYNKLSLSSRIVKKIKFKIQEFFFRRYDVLFVEHEDVKKKLIAKRFDSKRIMVVSNTISSIYDNIDSWEPISIPALKTSDLCLGYIGRAYEHKNISIISDVVSVLWKDFGINVNVIVTLTDQEFESLGFDTNANIFTIGPLNVSQCPSFYKNIDMLIFPSLLECFSASPIEALKMGVPVLASDRSFIREICKDSVLYFDPHSPEDVARLIYDLHNNKEKINLLKGNGYLIVKNLPSARDRALSYLSTIYDV
ncbi:TPA: glycosyltransferase [Vibrio vulnificus]|nr:glycosyltransferase [Vibrio vulnificus]